MESPVFVDVKEVQGKACQDDQDIPVPPSAVAAIRFQKSRGSR